MQSECSSDPDAVQVARMGFSAFPPGNGDRVNLDPLRELLLRQLMLEPEGFYECCRVHLCLDITRHIL